MAVQIAKAQGAARIVATCSPRNFDLVKSLGANEVVNYRDQDVFALAKLQNDTFDLIFDTVGGGKSIWDGGSEVLSLAGHFVTITGDVQRELDIPELLTRGFQLVARNLFTIINLGVMGYHQYTQFGGNYITLNTLGILVRDGRLRPIVDRVFHFNITQVKQAFAYLATGRAQGKVVITLV